MLLIMQEGNPTESKYTAQQEAYIDFVATGGLKVFPDGTFERQKYSAFAEAIGVARSTLWKWENRLPGFWEEVDSRRMHFRNKRLSSVENALYTAAMNPKSGQQVSAIKLMFQQARKLEAEKMDMNTNHTGEVNFTNGVPRNN
jgi:hypothetical protein